MYQQRWSRGYHNKDAHITFDAYNHEYKVDWNRDGKYRTVDVSVTSFISKFFPVFNARDAAKRCIKGNGKSKLHNNDGPKRKRFKSRYKKMTVEELEQKWKDDGKEARDKGTILHADIERWFNDHEESQQGKTNWTGISTWTPTTECDEIKQFMNYTENPINRAWEPLRVEWMIHSDIKTRMVGCIDMVYVVRVDDDGTLVLALVDWKRTKKINQFAFNGECGTGPCSSIKNANFFKYSLQLSMYKFIIDNYYEGLVWKGKVYEKVRVSDLWLVCFHEKRKNFIKFKCPYLGPTIDKMLKTRIKD